MWKEKWLGNQKKWLPLNQQHFFDWLLLDCIAYTSTIKLMNKHHFYYLHLTADTMTFADWGGRHSDIRNSNSTHAYWGMHNGCWKDWLYDLSVPSTVHCQNMHKPWSRNFKLSEQVPKNALDPKVSQAAAPQDLPRTCGAVSNVF